jgi:hypothetical protein
MRVGYATSLQGLPIDFSLEQIAQFTFSCAQVSQRPTQVAGQDRRHGDRKQLRPDGRRINGPKQERRDVYDRAILTIKYAFSR